MRNGSLIRYTFLAGIILMLIYGNGCKPEKISPLEQQTREILDEISADSIGKYVGWLQSMGTRFCLANNRKTVATAIKNKFISFGYTDVKLDSFQITKRYNNVDYTQMQYNVIATVAGSSNPDSIFIIGGHYDNILRTGTGDPFTTSYGANDNASGTAATLEVARVLATSNFDPEYTIRFIAFGAEELGLLGSYNYANKASAAGENICMMLNNDMIAFMPTTDKNQWVVNIMDYDNSHDLRYSAQDLAAKYTCLKFTNINTYNRQSDSYPFSLKGYKAIFFFANASDPNYHTLNDLSGQCNFPFCAEVTKVNCALLVDANSPLGN